MKFNEYNIMATVL